MKPFRREIVLSFIGIAATVIGFAVSVLWGWRVLGLFLMFMAAWVVSIGQAAYLVPGWKAGYLTGRHAVVAAIVSAAVGLALVVNSKDLARFTYSACHAMHVCEAEVMCTNDDVLSVPSTTRSVRAVRFVRTCSSGSPPTTHVSILPMGEGLPDEAGNAFIIDGKADLTLLWADGKHLTIAGAGNATRRLQQTPVNGVRISYEELPRQ